MTSSLVKPGLYPKGECRPTDSRAEIKIFKALRERLPSGWYAWHSLRIRTSDNIFGEGDFVVADPGRGLLVLEVKGGAIAVRDGRWLQNGIPLERAPLDQGHQYLKKLLERLKDQGFSPPAVGVAACFPDTGFDREPAQDNRHRAGHLSDSFRGKTYRWRIGFGVVSGRRAGSRAVAA